MRGQHHGKRLRPGLFVAIIVDREPHRNAGVVDDDVESAEMGRDVVHDGNDVIAIGDIEGPGPGLSAIGGDFIGDGLRTLRTNVGHRDVGAFGREHARGSLAHAAGGAGDENGQAFDRAAELFEI